MENREIEDQVNQKMVGNKDHGGDFPEPTDGHGGSTRRCNGGVYERGPSSPRQYGNVKHKDCRSENFSTSPLRSPVMVSTPDGKGKDPYMDHSSEREGCNESRSRKNADLEKWHLKFDGSSK
ncbi:unnamed protein product, partial [Ceratitis capitata]